MAKILLIEPDRILAKTYSEALINDGHKVVAVATAQTAIQAADALVPELVILELQLVEHSGIEFLYEFRSYIDWRDIPVLVQSQVPLAEFAANWRLLNKELGVRAYLYKPQTSLTELLKHVADATIPVIPAKVQNVGPQGAPIVTPAKAGAQS